MEKNGFLKLVDKYLAGTASPDEQALLEEYYKRLEASGMAELSPEQEQILKDRLYANIWNRMGKAEARVVPMRRRLFIRIASVAAAIFVLVAAYWMFTANSDKADGPVAQNEKVSSIDLPPGRDAAVLTMADGKKIVLDSTTGTISKQDGTIIINLNGLLTYSPSTDEKKVEYHTISTARGNQYQLLLADGSKVYLNSASSLHFPSAFTGSTREVELTSGEAYFDITTNPERPFHVKTREMTIEVTGTHFNVNAYNDEGPVATTLVEGKVKVSSGAGSVDLKPGEQTTLSIYKGFYLVTQPDINKVIAWRTGFFEFDQLDISAIMRQVSRWYDVDVEYEGKITTEKFGGRFSKQLPLLKLLKLLEENGVQFRLEGKRVVVKS